MTTTQSQIMRRTYRKAACYELVAMLPNGQKRLLAYTLGRSASKAWKSARTVADKFPDGTEGVLLDREPAPETATLAF